MTDSPFDSVVHKRQGKAWSVEEDRQLYDGFVAGQPMEALVSAHERSAGGIRSRLVRLGLIDQDGRTVEPAPPFAAISRRPSAMSAAPSSAAQDGAMRAVFAIRTGDGWAIEIKSNRPLSRTMVDRLMTMLNGVVAEEER